MNVPMTDRPGPPVAAKQPRPVNLTLQRLVDRYWPSRVARELRKRSKPGWRPLPHARGEWTLVFHGGARRAHEAIGALERAVESVPEDSSDYRALNLLRNACVRAELSRVRDYLR